MAPVQKCPAPGGPASKQLLPPPRTLPKLSRHHALVGLPGIFDSGWFNGKGGRRPIGIERMLRYPTLVQPVRSRC
jgi:hypothetical protein